MVQVNAKEDWKQGDMLEAIAAIQGGVRKELSRGVASGQQRKELMKDVSRKSNRI